MRIACPLRQIAHRHTAQKNYQRSLDAIARFGKPPAK
jgi:hypothetical protein